MGKNAVGDLATVPPETIRTALGFFAVSIRAMSRDTTQDGRVRVRVNTKKGEDRSMLSRIVQLKCAVFGFLYYILTYVILCTSFTAGSEKRATSSYIISVCKIRLTISKCSWWIRKFNGVFWEKPVTLRSLNSLPLRLVTNDLSKLCASKGQTMEVFEQLTRQNWYRKA